MITVWDSSARMLGCPNVRNFAKRIRLCYFVGIWQHFFGALIVVPNFLELLLENRIDVWIGHVLASPIEKSVSGPWTKSTSSTFLHFFT